MDKSKEILIIDDSNTNIVLMDAILTEKGYIIKTAFSALEAQNRILNNTPDLILLDLNMPKTHGYELLQELKQDKKTQHIPVIIVSAHTDINSKEDSKKYGAIDFIEKPINIDTLVLKVEKVLTELKS